MVRAKFYVGSNVPNNATREEDKGNTITLYAVTSGSKENEEFYKWTPSGNIILSTINPNAAEQFEVGREFYVDFTKIE